MSFSDIIIAVLIEVSCFLGLILHSPNWKGRNMEQPLENFYVLSAFATLIAFLLKLMIDYFIFEAIMTIFLTLCLSSFISLFFWREALNKPTPLEDNLKEFHSFTFRLSILLLVYDFCEKLSLYISVFVFIACYFVLAYLSFPFTKEKPKQTKVN